MRHFQSFDEFLTESAKINEARLIRRYTIEEGKDGIPTNVIIFEDGITLEQKIGSKFDRVFITEEQFRQIKFL